MENVKYKDNILLSFRNNLFEQWGMDSIQFLCGPVEALKKDLGVNLFERFQIIEEVSLFFKHFSNDIFFKEDKFFSSYDEFKTSIKNIELKARTHTKKMTEYAKDNARKIINSVLIEFYPQKNTFMKFCFAMDVPLEVCNRVLKGLNYDEIYSRNIEEGLFLFYLNKIKEIDITKLRPKDTLFQDIYTYELLVYKHKKEITRVLGKEISDVIIDNEILSEENKIIIKKNSRIPSIFRNRKKEKATVGEIVNLLNESISKYNELYSLKKDDNISQPFTTQFLNEQLKKAFNVKEVEALLETQEELWCKNRNKPLKRIIELIMSSPKSIREKSISQFAYEMFSFYCYKDYSDNGYYRFALANNNLDTGSKKGERYIFIESHFDRDLTNALFGTSQISRIQYITILIYLMSIKHKSKIGVADIDAYLDESSFAVLGISQTDDFIKKWIETYNDSSCNMTLQDAMEKTFEKETKKQLKNYYPLSWK